MASNHNLKTASYCPVAPNWFIWWLNPFSASNPCLAAWMSN